jgi:hypothetical protein
MEIDIGIDFHERLANRNKYQGDGRFTAEEFRKKYLGVFDNNEFWNNQSEGIILNFQNVRKIGPSFANEAFAYFMKYTTPEKFYKKVKFTNLSRVQKMIIDQELKTGYSK